MAQVPTRKRSKVTAGLRLRSRHILPILAVCTLVISSLAFSEPMGWPEELFSHFRVQYAVVALLLLFWGMVRLAWMSTVASLVALSLNLWVVIPYLAIGPAAPPALERARIVNVMSVNLFQSQDSLNALAARVIDNPPDLLVLVEAPENAKDLFPRLFPTLRYVYSAGEFNLGQVHVLSATEAAAQETVWAPGRIWAGLKVRFCNAGIRLLAAVPEPGSEEKAAECLTMFALHSSAPITPIALDERDALLMSVAEEAGKAQAPKLIVGDLNTTPWSGIFRAVRTRAGVIDSGLGRGLRTTWGPSVFPLNAVRIPIDHILISPDIAVLDRSVGDYIGSDHVPVSAVLALPD